MTNFKNETLQTIKELVNNYGGIVFIDDVFVSENNTRIYELILKDNNELFIQSKHATLLKDSFLTSEDLKKLLEYLKKMKPQKYRVEVNLSRTFNVTAMSAHEASEIAKKRFEKKPIKKDDFIYTKTIKRKN